MKAVPAIAPRHPPWLASTCALAALVLAGGCLFETPRACGPNMVLNDVNVCVCAPDAVLAEDAHGFCVPCGANQVVQAGACACRPGFIKDAAGACVERPPGLNESCDPAAPACPNPAYARCQMAASGTGGYCTKAGCTAPADCPSGYACDATVSGGVCTRPPTGQGTACSSGAQCAGFEATFCAPILNQCLYQGCVPDGSPCSPGHRCCDLTALGAAIHVCLPVGTCP